MEEQVVVVVVVVVCGVVGAVMEGNGAFDTDSESFSPIQVRVPDSDEADIAEHIYTFIHMRKRSKSDD